MFLVLEAAFEAQAISVCQGQTYTIGCGEGNGDRVLNVTKVLLTMAEEIDAQACEDGLLCVVTIGEGKRGKIKRGEMKRGETREED